MKLVKTTIKLRWVGKANAVWVVQLQFDDGQVVEVDDPKVIEDMYIFSKGWLHSEELGHNHLPRLEK